MIGAQAGPQKSESLAGTRQTRTESKTDNEILSDIALECKSFDMLQARAFRLGYSLAELGTGTFLVSRAGHHAHCAGLDSVRVFLGQVTGGRA